MQLKKLTRILLISCSILALGACSTNKHPNQANVSEAAGGEGGAMASGVGQGDEFANGSQRGASIQHRTYYFDFDRSEVHESDKPAIFANAEYLVAHSNARIILEGHTDPRGSREYNVALGERRAMSVADLLKSKGVASNQIRVVSYGAERLAAPGHTEEDFQRDRRVVLVYQQK